MNRLDLLSHRDQHHDYRQNAEKFHGFPQIPSALTKNDPLWCAHHNGSFFVSAEAHVEREDKVAKFWTSPVRLERSGGFSRQEINRIQNLVEENAEALLRSWNEYFQGGAA